MAGLLWVYDTRTTTHRERVEQLAGLMTGEEELADVDSVLATVPPEEVWGQLAQIEQYATAEVDAGRYPESFREVLQNRPELVRQNGVYAVTVTGRQSIHWTDGGRGAEERAITLAVQCRPDTLCALVGVLPGVAP
ncbi:hypothetical protein [Streptomyces triticirhizae]|uniref:hypothetical protein n=1 Tax=Streptomyces triticirhizae TaxID=2483353 RepID=UPI0011C3E7CF|nr:hypothetical protein [Streptomyces triticirhizae]